MKPVCDICGYGGEPFWRVGGGGRGYTVLVFYCVRCQWEMFRRRIRHKAAT